MFQMTIGRIDTTNATHINIDCRLNNSERCGFDQHRKRAMQASCRPLVNLARNPKPIISPSPIQCHVWRVSSAIQKTTVAQAHAKTLNESIVIRIDPTASIGINNATNNDNHALRSPYSRRASEKIAQPVAVLSITAKNRTPKTVSPNNFVPRAIVHATPGPLSRYDAARCLDQTQ